MDNDWISRAEAINAVYYKPNHKMAIEVLKEVPAVDAVPVVRCKDCMYWREIGEGIGECERLEVADSDPEITHAFQTAHDWFCADGERAPTCGPDYCEIGDETNADG